ncbi:MAG TPA: hypothetical protein DCL35_02630 [Candidatus Omnitrophica bacterium]|nr:hypothetical protein [Candidatus Omnitrophota bacterium]
MVPLISDNKNTGANAANMAIALTHHCQMNCRYCGISSKSFDMRQETLYKSIDILFSAQHNDIELQFFGGEPLIRFDLINKAVSYSREKAENTKKEITFLLTTNGLLLNRKILDYFRALRATVLLSLDGAPAAHLKSRPLKNKNGPHAYESIMHALRGLQERKMDFFINLVYTEKNLKILFDNVSFLAANGIKKIKLSYAVGSKFKESDACAVYGTLEEIFHAFPALEFPGSCGENEPILATPQITVDSTGMVYRGCALVLEKKYPGFNRLMRVGPVKDAPDYKSLQRTAAQQTEFLLERKREIPAVLLDNLRFGQTLKELLSARRMRT